MKAGLLSVWQVAGKSERDEMMKTGKWAELDEHLEALRVFYEDVDSRTRSLSDLHGERLRCRNGCSDCCVDEISVFEIEAENIMKHHAGCLKGEDPHPAGACAFLDEKGECRIYEHRPYVCQTQGFPLRWLDERDNGSFAEMRDICPLNEKGKPIEDLSEEECWTIGPFEERLAEIQFRASGGKMPRVSLRTLFAVLRIETISSKMNP